MSHVSLPIFREGRQVSHLAVHFTAAARGPGHTGILYLHGFGSDQEGEKASFFRQRATEAGLAFCSFDFQGHGRSGGSMRGLTLTRNLADIRLAHEEVLRRGMGRVVLLGSSMGGAAALWYSALHPGEVKAGMHIAPALGMGPAMEQQVGEDGLAAWQRDGARAFDDGRVRCDLGWELVEDLRRYPTDRLLGLYRTPALLLQGKGDTSVDWRQVLDFAVSCPFEELELHLFSDGDHRLVDRKERLWRLMEEFLAGRELL